MSRLVRVGAAAAILIAVVAPAASVAASVGVEREMVYGFINYDGTYTHTVTTDPAGLNADASGTEVYEAPLPAQISCDSGTCLLYWDAAFGVYFDIPVVDGVIDTAVPQTGDFCDYTLNFDQELFSPAVSVVGRATETDIVLDAHLQGVPWTECNDGSSGATSERYTEDWHFEGTYVEGDLCIVQPGGCDSAVLMECAEISGDGITYVDFDSSSSATDPVLAAGPDCIYVETSSQPGALYDVVFLDDGWAKLREIATALLVEGWLPDSTDFSGDGSTRTWDAAEIVGLPAEPPARSTYFGFRRNGVVVVLGYTAFAYGSGTSGYLEVWSQEVGRGGGLGLDTPSVLSGLRTIAEVVSPQAVAFASGGAVVLGLLLAIPSQLLGRVKDRLLPPIVARLRAWWRRVRGLTEVAAAPKPVAEPVRYAGWRVALAGLAGAAVITVFVDPGAGANLGTLRLALSVLLAFTFDIALGWVGLIFAISRLVPSAVPRFQFKPWTLALLVGGVAFTRIAQLAPGVTVGVVAGVVIGGLLAARDRARLSLLVLGYGFVLAILAWVAYSLLAPAVGGADAGLGAVFLRETLAATTVAGIVALPVSLLPIRGMTGFDVFSWNRVAWAAAYFVGLAGFLLVLVPLPSSWSSVPLSFLAWLVLVLLYLAVAVAAWLAVFRPWRVDTEDEKAAPVAQDVEATHR